MIQPTTPANPVLTAAKLVFSHAGQPALRLFDQLSFVVLPGVTWVSGGEGSGKTTLLQLLAGALPADAVEGHLGIHSASLAESRSSYQQQVAWLDPRSTALDPQSARQIFAEQPRLHPAWDRTALELHIAGLSLAPHLDKALYMLSSGTRRKVLMAAAMASMAPVTLLDQPFMALDGPSIAYLRAVLATAAQQGVRAWVVADYEAPAGVALAGTVELTAGCRD